MLNVDRLSKHVVRDTPSMRPRPNPASDATSEPVDQVRPGDGPSCLGTFKSCLPHFLKKPAAAPLVDPAFEDAHAAEKNRLVDGMLARSPNFSNLTPEVVGQFRDELRAVPLDVLRVTDRNHVAITAMMPGQSVQDLGVIDPVDLSAAYADADALGRKARSAARPINFLCAFRLHRLEAKVQRQAEAAARRQAASAEHGWGWDDDDDDDDDPEGDLSRLRVGLAHQVRDAVFGATDGRVELYHERRAPDPRMGGRVARLAAAFEDVDKAVSLKDIAREHGALTPQQFAEYQALVMALNGDRVRRAQEKYAAQQGAVHPAELPLEERPFMAVNEQIFVPSCYYRDEGNPSGEKPARVISWHDQESILTWESPYKLGQYFYLNGKNTVVVRANKEGTVDGGTHSTVVHEMGHAYQLAVSELAPATGRRYDRKVDSNYERCMREKDYDHNPFPTRYAETSSHEFFADSFAVRFGSQPESLREKDSRWADALDGYLSLSHDIARADTRS